MKKIIFFVLISGIAFASCKKKDKTPPAPSKTEIVQEGKWKLTSANFNGIYDLVNDFEACQKDNFYLFNTNKTITVDEGATKCDPSTPQNATDGMWELQSNDTKIVISGSSITAGLGSLSGDIIEISNTKLQFKKDTTISGFPGTINITFTNIK